MTDSAHVAPLLRICIVTPSYAPDIGGLASIATGLAEGLASLGHSVEVATQVAPRIPRGADGLTNVVVHRFTNAVGGRRFGYSPRLSWWVMRNQRRFDVVHAFSYHAPVGLVSALTVSRPFVFTPTFHGGGHSRLASLVHLVYRRLSGVIFRRARVVICGSYAERDALVSEFPRAQSRVVVIPFALEERAQMAAEPFSTSGTVILSVGRLDDYKKTDLLVSAMAHLGSDARLVICGDGPDRVRLGEIAVEAHVESRVDLLGFVSDEDLARWRATASVVVSLSTHESFGLSLVEGAVTGAPLVLSDIAPHREVVDLLNVAAEFVPVGASPDNVASAITAALSRTRSSVRPTLPTWEDRARDTVAAYESAIRSVSTT